MQNRYAGDVGDFGKLGLLRVLSSHITIGVNWYLVDTPDGEVREGAPSFNDGGHVKYLCNSSLCACDPDLASKLTLIVSSNHTKRCVKQLQRIIPTISYYDNKLTCENRRQWFASSLTTLFPCDLVFLDPDNGIEVASMTRAKSIKFAFRDELISYYESGHSVICYNHRSREPAHRYMERINALLNAPAFDCAEKSILRFHPYSVRDYIFLVQPTHVKKVDAAISEFKTSLWCLSKFKPFTQLL